ncbi:MAG: PTS sugar transporter subunit IIA [Geminicoccaceae bacterium]|nr:PTS sugar transporter subunit IIA [Geminicoccaceae bacterium]
MSELDALLGDDRIILGLDAGSKRQVLRAAADRAASSLGLSAERVLNALLERERLGTTGIGQGLAIPHAKLDEIDAVAGVFLRLDHPVDFEAADGRPVDLLFVLLAPSSSGADHLKALAKVSRVFRNAPLCAALRAAPGVAAARRLLSGTS